MGVVAKYSHIMSVILVIIPYLGVFAMTQHIYDWTNYLHTHTLIRLLIVNVIFTIIVFAFSVVFQNSSFYDPYWFTSPFRYVLLLSSLTDYAYTFRNVLVITPLLCYCVKQNICYFRSWPGFSYEDFRYVQFKEIIKNPVFYWIFSLVSFHLFPTMIVFFGMTPYYYILNVDPASQNLLETTVTYLGSFVSLTGVLIEICADKQLFLWKNLNTNQCINHGLWKFSRHPNYFGQICIWIGIFIPILSLSSPPYWTAIGCILVVLLINFYSIPTMEQHLLKNRPSYQLYQQNVSRLIPSFCRNKNKKFH